MEHQLDDAAMQRLRGTRPSADREPAGRLSRAHAVLTTAALCTVTGFGPAAPSTDGPVWGRGRIAEGSGASPADVIQEWPRPEPGHGFYFTRAAYSSDGRSYWRRADWATDFPKADEQFLFVFGRLMPLLDLYRGPNPVRLDDPELRRFPFLYALEVGDMDLTEAEIEGLRGYLEAGGFLLVDDFWGTREWENFERQIARVLPGRPIVEISVDHPLLHQFFDIDEIIQVPSLYNARGGPTYERDGRVPHLRGIFDEDGDLMVAINWNTDLGDAWEWSEQPDYPLEYSNFAYEMAINFIVYAMTH